jgi:hypothetical protein
MEIESNLLESGPGRRKPAEWCRVLPVRLGAERDVNNVLGRGRAVYGRKLTLLPSFLLSFPIKK